MARIEPDISVKGFEQLDEATQKLVQSLSPGTVEPILLHGATIMADKVRSLAPHGPTGNLISGIVAKTLRRQGNNPAPSIAAINYRRAPHAHLVEYGTSERFVKHKKVMYSKKTGKFYGKSVGAMPAHPFFRPGVEMSKEQAMDDIINRLSLEIEDAWR
jgi:HK97 gp10 family phage protein